MMLTSRNIPGFTGIGIGIGTGTGTEDIVDKSIIAKITKGC